MNLNVFDSVTSPRVRCVLRYFLTTPVGFNFNLTIGLKPQVGGIKIVTVWKRSIFQVEWLIATLIFFLFLSDHKMEETNVMGRRKHTGKYVTAM